MHFSFGVIKALLEVIQGFASARNIPFMGVTADYNPESRDDGKLVRAFWYDMNLLSIHT